MKTDLHLVFPGTCNEAFAFYETVFGVKRLTTMSFGDAPFDPPMPPETKDLVMHTALPLGSITLMGCDAMPSRPSPIGGFHVSLSVDDADEVHRLFTALSEGGSVMMPPGVTFWSPLFSMVDDKFGVGWMIGIPGPQM